MESSLNCFVQIKKAQKIAIIVHVNADTDALASAISLKRIIRDNFEGEDKKYEVDIFTDTSEFNKKDEDLIKNENINNQNCRSYDLAIALDTPNRARLGIYDKIFRKSKDTLNLDHHSTNDKFAKNNIIASGCSSTCEMIYMIFVQINKLKCSPNTMGVLYSGIVTDTNNLTQNIGPKTFSVIDLLNKTTMQNGIDLDQVRSHYFKNNTKEQNALLCRALNSLTYSDNGKIAMMKITKQDFNETNTSINDTLGIVDFAVNTQGVQVGVIFIKQEDNTYYVSLRSKDSRIDVGEIAKKMGGGGHAKVAAFQTKPNDNLTDIKTKLTNLCNSQFDKTDNIEEDISSLFAETAGNGPTEEEIEENR